MNPNKKVGSKLKTILTNIIKGDSLKVQIPLNVKSAGIISNNLDSGVDIAP